MASVLPFDHRESRRRRDQSERTRAGRKLLGDWRRELEDAIRRRSLIATDGRVADVLLNFPSSTTSGYLWASQTTLSDNLGISVSAVERSVQRLKRAGLLDVRQRGNGRSAIIVFCRDGKPIFEGAAPASVRAQGPASMRGLPGSAPARMREESDKSYESDKRESGQREHQAPSQSCRPQEQPRKRASGQAIQNQLVQRFGNGDIEQGWLLFGALDDLDRKQLERFMLDAGDVDDALLNEYRLAAAKRLRETSAQGGAT